MPLIRLIVILGIIAGLVVFALSNWATVLPLTFLGIKTPAFPLSIWIVGAIAVGILANLLLTLLFRFSSYTAARTVRAQFRRANRRAGFHASPPPPQPEAPRSYTRSTRSTAVDEDADWKNWDGYEEPVDRTSAPTSSPNPAASTSADDDWDTELNEDWDVEEPPVDSYPTSREPVREPVRDDVEVEEFDDPRTVEYQSPERLEFERQQEPKRVSRSGSVYSYSYRDQENPAVGRPESVVDAEYRVLIPPYRPLEDSPEEAVPLPRPEKPDPPARGDADDWFEEGGEEDWNRSDRR